jgi:hypothetical protein
MKCPKRLRAMKSSFKNTDGISITELVNQMSCAPHEYKNLQIFLHWDREINYHLETEYLLVSPSCFGKVKISNLSVENNYVVIDYVDCQTQELGSVHVKINEEKPSILFINWNDIRSMFDSTKKTSINNSELLEFDY